MSTEGERAEETPARDLSFADLFARHYLPALRLAVLLEGDQTRAEDAVCDAFARVYARVRRGAVDDPGPYLRQAIVNAVRGGWRRRAVERRHAAAIAIAEASGEFEAGVSRSNSGIWFSRDGVHWQQRAGSGA